MSTRKKQLFKIIILGDSGWQDIPNESVQQKSLKQCFIFRYVNQKFTQQYRATVGADFMAKDVILDDRMVTLQIWDTAGQERFQSLGGAFYRGADCCVLVYDIVNMKSFESLESWKEEFILQGNPKEKETFPFVILDKINERKVSEVKVQQWCKSQGSNFTFFECSAKESTNVESAFQTIAKLAASQEKDEELFFPTTVDLKKTNYNAQQKKGSCC